MPAAVNGNQFHLHLGVFPPEHLLDVNSIGHMNLIRFRRGGDVVEVRTVST